MLSTVPKTTQTVRNVFVIDDKGIIRVILIYPLNVGRCIPEILRIVEALQTADCNNASTPANWVPGNPIITHSPTTFCDLQERVEKNEQNNNSFSWYLTFKEPEKNCIENKV